MAYLLSEVPFNQHPHDMTVEKLVARMRNGTGVLVTVTTVLHSDSPLAAFVRMTDPARIALLDGLEWFRTDLETRELSGVLVGAAYHDDYPVEAVGALWHRKKQRFS